MDAVRPSEGLGVRVDSRTCFSNHKGEYKKGIEGRQTKLLRKVAPVLRAHMEADEEVLLVAPACSPMDFLEQLTTGAMIYYLKRCLLVLTNKRILHLPTKSNYTPRLSLAEVRYGDIDEAQVRSFLGRKLTLKYRSGKKDVFQQVHSSVTKKLKTLLKSLGGRGEATPAAGRRHLCPRCSQPLGADSYRCTHCFLEFKTPAKALKYSILFPGGGYFYTGHPLLGVLDALVEGFLLIVVITGLVNIALGDDSADALMGFVLVLALLVFEKLITIFHARHDVKEYLPVESSVSPIRAGP